MVTARVEPEVYRVVSPEKVVLELSREEAEKVHRMLGIVIGEFDIYKALGNALNHNPLCPRWRVVTEDNEPAPRLRLVRNPASLG